ncbi:unnamed protein product [Phytophthora fragariaefolia]|uniref:Unnamed protein product n=1 Tax=Phytophthora fragariaefolia TaxID=1490495 RepID=A0A9W7CSW1_9STRA|nr:unnamed protein product [Phytophthora fragariaefolia]
MATASGRVPRPFGETLKATKPNEVLHFDYLTMVEGEGSSKFGVVRQWVSNQGAHFRNQVVESLQRALGAQNHFTTAHTPWTNGTVEVVNREVLKSVKALLRERKLPVRDWPSVLLVVQSALNGMPADRLGGKSPLTPFTALPGGAQLQHILHPRDPTDTTVQRVDQEILAHLSKVRVALDGMHAEMVYASDKRRRAARTPPRCQIAKFQ